jgi:hypothetical protein
MGVSYIPRNQPYSRMLSLNAKRWNDLRDAYGSGAGIPALLIRLGSHPSSSVWDEIWSRLCHQSTINTATIAAVPHIVAMARSLPVGARTDFLHFVGSVAAAEDQSCILDELRPDYTAAVAEASDLAFSELKACPASEADTVYLLGALAALCGCKPLGRIMEGFVEDEFSLTCPKCRTMLYVWPSEECYRVFAEDPVTNPDVPSTGVTPRLQPDQEGPITVATICCKNAPQWIPSLAIDAGFPELAERAIQLFGAGICPACNAEFQAIDRLMEQAR